MGKNKGCRRHLEILENYAVVSFLDAVEAAKSSNISFSPTIESSYITDRVEKATSFKSSPRTFPLSLPSHLFLPPPLSLSRFVLSQTFFIRIDLFSHREASISDEN